jgi:hypothetical protein
MIRTKSQNRQAMPSLGGRGLKAILVDELTYQEKRNEVTKGRQSRPNRGRSIRKGEVF